MRAISCSTPGIVPRRAAHRRERGAIIIIAMLFLVIFSSLAAAMAIISQGNLVTADSHMKINRSLAAAETGLTFLSYRIDNIANTVTTRDGQITSANAPAMWNELRLGLIDEFTADIHCLATPHMDGDTLVIGPVSLGGDAPNFTAYLTPHPLADEDYDSDYYARPPYNEMSPVVSASAPLDATWVRVRIEATDGPVNALDPDDTQRRRITRSIQVDYQIGKRIPYAILARSRVMIGRNVMIEGPIGSRFEEVHLEHGHPIQMLSDFSGLKTELDADLQLLRNTLAESIDEEHPEIDRDTDGDNRINLGNPVEADGIDPALDLSGDGYIDDYDFFLKWYDLDGNTVVTALELETDTQVNNAQLFELLDTSGNPLRPGYDDGQIDENDRYAKIRGQIHITASKAAWEAGAADGVYQDYLQGSIHPDYRENPVTFEASESDVYQYDSSDFSETVSLLRADATGDMMTQATTQAALHDPDDPTSPQPIGETAFEAVPFGAAYPYDYYERPVFENMTFENIVIPKGTNALFKNCKFVGVTFVETSADNVHPMYNYAGMVEEDGSLKYPDKVAEVDGVEVSDTKTTANNVRFHGCTFEGSVVSDVPQEFTHVRNKIAFTGTTKFVHDPDQLSQAELDKYRRSTIMAPHYSVEMGTFVEPYNATEKVELSGTIVTGIADMRGQVKIDGTLLTTFAPISDTGPVLGETSPQFNTTLGYFGSADGDLESELPNQGIGVIHVRYDPTMPLPDGILGPIEMKPVMATYSEGGR